LLNRKKVEIMNKIKSLTPMGILAIVAGVSAVVMWVCSLPVPALFCLGFAAFSSAVSQLVVTAQSAELISE